MEENEKYYPCACCGFLTLSEGTHGTYEICPVCFWEDDEVQFKNLDLSGGANEESLYESRENFKKFGASSKRHIRSVRAPEPDEIPLKKVSLNEIKAIFDDLIQEKKTREEVSNWASRRQFANDNESLEFEPPKEKRKIWEGIIYLIGVDLLDMDGSYLHSIDNFIDFRSEMFSLTNKMSP